LSLADRATDRAARARRVRDALVAAGVELRAATA
jgi:hypothetical protein